MTNVDSIWLKTNQLLSINMVAIVTVTIATRYVADAYPPNKDSHQI